MMNVNINRSKEKPLCRIVGLLRMIATLCCLRASCKGGRGFSNFLLPIQWTIKRTTVGWRRLLFISMRLEKETVYFEGFGMGLRGTGRQ